MKDKLNAEQTAGLFLMTSFAEPSAALRALTELLTLAWELGVEAEKKRNLGWFEEYQHCGMNGRECMELIREKIESGATPPAPIDAAETQPDPSPSSVPGTSPPAPIGGHGAGPG